MSVLYNLHGLLYFWTSERIHLDFILLLIYFFVLEMEPKALCMIDRHSTSELHHQSEIVLMWNKRLHCLRHPATACSQTFF
jgi:hypothetical protein